MRAVIAVAAVLWSGCVGEPGPVPAESFPDPGDYALSWDRQGGADEMPATNYTRLTIEPGRLVYWCEACSAPTVEDAATVDTETPAEGPCLTGGGIPQGAAGPTRPYSLCPVGGGVGAGIILHAGHPEPTSEAVWRMTASPL